MTPADGTAVQVTLSGRELALMRRQVMALRGKAGVVKSIPTRAVADVAVRPAMAMSSAPTNASVAAARTNTPMVAVASTASAARLRRQALSQSGKAALPVKAAAPRRARAASPASLAPAASCGCGCNGGGCATTTEAAVVASSATSFSSATASGVPALDMGSTRALARARRVALATDGKNGLRRVAQATKLATVLPQQDWQLAIDKGASGRQVAMQRRLVRALVGRSDTSSDAPRPSGRVRARNEVPAVAPKVAQGHTLSGQSVTGTLVDSTRKVTGGEAGLCRNITGTEYLGVEQFDTLCGTRPAPGVAKVGVSSTLSENKVTGTEVGRSAHVTGDEVGACRGITGTEYLAREHYETMCDTTPVAAPRKVSVMSSRGGQQLSGTELSRSGKVTGDEIGASRQLTGSQYVNTTDVRRPVDAKAPAKVATVQTLAGSTVTGTEVGRSPKVTGDDKGGCRPVTGTEYIGTQQLQSVCAASTPVAPVAKVGQDQTWRGQTITGSNVGRSNKVTGDEDGGCAPISGTPYIGRGQYKAFCEAPQLASQQARIRAEAVIPAAAVTGSRPGAGGSVMTGDERGACEPVSGTPYVGLDNAPTQCQASGRFVPRARPRNEAPAAPAPQAFSIRPPARQAQESRLDAVTGTAFSGQRITGPVNKAGGLITGTPEFRHSEGVSFQAPQIEVASASKRLTGEGSQAGTRISGDAWHASGRVTGTEGTSSLARNPSQRGQARDMGMTARQFRDVERAAQPESRITGSSGNTVKGAAVTLSGGARG